MDNSLKPRGDNRSKHQYDSPLLDLALRDLNAMRCAVEASGMTLSNCQALIRSMGGLIAKLGSRSRYAALDRFFDVIFQSAKLNQR